jgi:hypothetical protein
MTLVLKNGEWWLSLDKFPGAFKRFEQVVDVSKIETFRQLKLAFQSWAGKKWLDTPRQVEALRVEAVKLGIPEVEVTIEEYFAEKRLVDRLYRRVYYCVRRREYNKARLEEWKSYHGKVVAQAVSEKWTPEELHDVEGWILPRIHRAEERVRYWESQWIEAYNKLKVEHEKFVKMKVVWRRAGG